MSAKDIFHEAVKQALQKEQWIITDDPLKFKFGNVNFQVDLGAERLLAADRGDEKIAVEIKRLFGKSRKILKTPLQTSLLLGERL